MLTTHVSRYANITRLVLPANKQAWPNRTTHIQTTFLIHKVLACQFWDAYVVLKVETLTETSSVNNFQTFELDIFIFHGDKSSHSAELRNNGNLFDTHITT